MRITGRVDLYGVVGYPVKHSLSPVFQNAAFSHLGIEAVYVPFEIKPEDLRDGIRGLMLSGVRGLNVTVPHKEPVLELASWISPEAEEIGAANTLKFSRAVLYALKQTGAEVLLWNRTRERAQKLAERFGVRTVNAPEEVLGEVEVVVNTTSVGLHRDDPPPLNVSLLRRDQVVVDLIYRETALLRKARERGCRVQNGFPMLVYQGAESFRIWTGCEAPLSVMKLSLLDFGYCDFLPSKDCSRTP